MANVKITCENVDVMMGNPMYNDGNQYLKVVLYNYNLDNLLAVLSEDYGTDVLIERLNSL